MSDLKQPRRQTIPTRIQLRIRALRAVAGLYIGYESLTTALWPLALWCAAFVSLWLLQVPQWFGQKIEVLSTALFFCGSLYLVWRSIKSVRLPAHGDITRRIEQDNHLAHRPLSSLEDTLANPSRPETRRLWSLWQDNLHPALLSLRWPRLRGVLPRLDPYAARAFMLCLLLVSFIIAGGTWDTRLRHGLAPFTFKNTAISSDNLILWVIPPTYTGQKQITLKGFGKKDDPVSIPEGSIVKARVNGWLGTPQLLFGAAAYPMTPLGKGSYGIEKIIENTDSLGIRQMLIPRSHWAVRYIPDTPPTMVMAGDLETQPRGAVIFPVKLRDDYSVENLHIRITRNNGNNTSALGQPYEETRAVLSPPGIDMEFKPEFDLAWHPWAGQEVTVTLTATDHKGQTATIKDLKLTLPERDFKHPVAKKLIELRKRLIWAPEAAANNVMHDLETIMLNPVIYHQDPIVFLALRSATSRLYYNPAERARVADVVELLWDTALRVEDGNFSLAKRSLRDAQKALENALKDPNATPQEIAEKMEQLRMAMGQYMQEMFRELQKQAAESGADMQMMSPESMMANINPDDIIAFLNKMQADALNGDRDSAREMLAHMERMMDMLDPAAMQMTMPQDMKDMMDAAQKIQDLIDRQKNLLSDTQDKAGNINQQQSYSQPLPPNAELLEQWGITTLPPQPQETRQGPSAPRRDVDVTNNKEEQDSIRASLGELMQDMGEKLGKIPDPMAKADMAMRDSTAALGAKNPGESIPHQESAIQHLSEGQKQLSQQMATRMKQMMMFSFGMGGRTDPLGRPMNDGDDGNNPWSASKVKIPDKAERRHVQDILDELRKKSGEFQRPAYERDYFKRLMKQF